MSPRLEAAPETLADGEDVSPVSTRRLIIRAVDATMALEGAVGRLTREVADAGTRATEATGEARGARLVGLRCIERVEQLATKLERQREDSSHDIQLVKGSLKEAVYRAMSERERAEFDRAQEEKRVEAKRLRRDLTVAIASNVAWPALAALAWAVWYVWHHLN